MAHLNLLRRLRESESGATIVEFALVSGVFFLMMCALIEYGMIMMTKIAIESTTQEVSRSNGVNPVIAGCAPNDRVCLVNKLLQQKTFGLINPAYVQVTSTVVSTKTTKTPPIPDLCLDTPGVPSPPTCITFLNNDGVPGYQQAAGVNTASLGSYDDLVELRVSYVWRVTFPLMKPFFTNNAVVLSSTTVVHNEPL